MCWDIYHSNTGKSSCWQWHSLGKGEQKVLVHCKEEKWASHKVKNVEEFTDHSHRETKQEHIDPRPSWRRKEEILLRKVGHSKASERRQRLEAVSNFSYSGSICIPPRTQNNNLFASSFRLPVERNSFTRWKGVEVLSRITPFSHYFAMQEAVLPLFQQALTNCGKN